jgi:hypothetical protein
MGKVFRYFIKNNFMNSKIAIPIVVGIIIVIIGIIAITNQENSTMEVEDALDKELQPTEEITPEIQERLDKIKKNVNDLESLETNYDPSRVREWITSGPFQIDRSEYALGENIFLRIGQLETTEKGQAAFLRPLNGTHYSVYITIPFDGTGLPFNQYFTPDLSKIKGVCSIDDIAGEWTVVFRGTDYENIKFTVSDKIFVPGNESRFESVC